MTTLSSNLELYDSESSSSSSLSDEDYSWIPWFCNLKGNEFFLPIDPEFIKDDFNLTGLANMVENYDSALSMILDSDIDESLTDYEQSQIESDAEILYGLIHARFLVRWQKDIKQDIMVHVQEYIVLKVMYYHVV